MAKPQTLLRIFGFAGLAVALISVGDMFRRRPVDGVIPNPYAGDGVLVYEVTPGSPADRAGIAAGDRILGIGRSMVRSPRAASRELLTFRVGQTVPYLVQKNGQRIPERVRVTLAGRRLGNSAYVYEAVIGFLFFAIGYLVFRRRPQDEAVRVFFALCVLFLLFFVCRLRPSSYWWVDLFVQQAGTASLFLLPAVFLHFFLVFPRRKRLRFADPPSDGLSPPPSRFAVGAQRFLNLSPLLYLVIYAIPPVVFIAYAREEMLGHPVALFSGAPLASWVLLGDYLVLGLAALAHSAWTLEDPAERRQVLQVFVGTILGTAPFLVFGIIFPAVFHTTEDVFYGIAPMILIPATFAYAIVRFQFLNVRIIVRKSLLYTATTAVIFALYAGALSAANLLFSNLRLASSRVFLFGFFLVVIPLFELLRRRLQNPIDRLFFREKLDFQRAVLEISEAMAGELDRTRVCDYLTARLTALLRLSGADVFLADRFGGVAGREERDIRVSSGSALSAVLSRAARPRLVADLASEVAADPGSAGALALLRARGYALLVPILYREQLGGFLAAKGKLSEEGFDRDEILLLETVASQAAATLETASLHAQMTQQAELRRDLEIARDIQTSLFPRGLPAVPGVRFAAGSIPARVVGGDFYDFLSFDHGSRLGLVIGDVSGKSIPASLLMVASREIVFAGSRGTEDPGELFRVSNRRIYEIKQRMFVALGFFLLDVEALSLRYAIAGQPLPILLRPGEPPRSLDPPVHRLPLGSLRDVPYDTREAYLKPRDLLFFYTDGFTEAMDGGMEPFGEERLVESLARHASEDLEATARGILADVRRHAGDAEQYDDMTFLLMSVAKGREG